MFCPKCKKAKYRLSHRRNLLEKLISFLGFRPVRCLGCNQRRLVLLPYQG